MSFPHDFFVSFPTGTIGEVVLPVRFVDARVGPPWLRRTHGARYMRGLYRAFDIVAGRSLESLRLRFPSPLRTDALERIGADRLIARGPTEAALAYAPRLRRWLDDHAVRGGAAGMLEQLGAYLGEGAAVDVVAYNGARHRLAAGELSRDTVSWSADLSGRWARVWIFVTLAAHAEVPDDYVALVRAWLAAHIERAWVAILSPGRELWDYPVPVGTWDVADAYWDVPGAPAIEEVS